MNKVVLTKVTRNKIVSLGIFIFLAFCIPLVQAESQNTTEETDGLIEVTEQPTQPPVNNAVPADTWWEDSGANIYNVNSGNVGIGDSTPNAKFAVGPNSEFRVTATGEVRTVNGTASAPAYSFVSDNNTGIIRSAADTLGLITAGAQRLTVNPSGNVGIGDTTPAATLTVGNGDLFQVSNLGLVRSVSGSATTPTYSFTADTDNGMFLGPTFFGSSNLKFATDGLERMTITGNTVTIGTTILSGVLAVEGNMRMKRDSEIFFQDNGAIKSFDDFHAIFFHRTDNNMELRDYGDIILSPGTRGTATRRMVLKDNGDICLGTGC